MTTKREAQAALNNATTFIGDPLGYRNILQAVIDAMPDDPESRAERLGRVAFEGRAKIIDAWYAWHQLTDSDRASWIAAAAAVAEQCKPREVTANVLDDILYNRESRLGTAGCLPKFAELLNAYVRGED